MSKFYQRSVSDSDESDLENAYCIVLHIVEGVGLHTRESGDFDRQKQIIMLHASLNGVKFEVEGHSTETSTIFQSNCIWESDIDNIKRMKTDNRPVKIECFIYDRCSRVSNKQIGTLLLPIRSLPILNQVRNAQVKLLWHKLTGLSSGWRERKPELHLLLAIVKKCYIDNGQFEAVLQKLHFGTIDPPITPVSETAHMLQSQSNIYVQLLEQVGLIQVGNNPDIDCDIYNISLTLKQIRGLECFNNNQIAAKHIVLSYDFLGSIPQLDIPFNGSDCYALNEKVSLSFKSSLQSLRMYFQCIFYIPFNFYINGIIVANYRFDFTKHLPEDAYFNLHKLWQKQSDFCFELPQSTSGSSTAKPTVDFIFSIQLMQSNQIVKNPNKIMNTFRIESNPHLLHLNCDTTAEDMTVAASDNYSTMERYIRDQSTLLALGAYQYGADDLVVIKSSEEIITVAVSQGTKSHRSLASNTSDIAEAQKSAVPNPSTVSIGINTTESLIEKRTVEDFENGTKRQIVKVNNSSRSTCSETSGDKEQTKLVSDVDDTSNTNHEELTFRAVQELEQWKKEQFYLFIKELEQYEESYWAELNAIWEVEKKELEKKLNHKIAICEELNEKLQQAYSRLNDSNQTVFQRQDSEAYKLMKSEIEEKYASKFEDLDKQMKQLKADVEKRSKTFDIQTEKLQQENSDLMYENSILNERVQQLEDRLHECNNHKSANEELKQVIEDLHSQRTRYAQVEKSRNYYKDEWIKSAQELNNLQLSMLKKKQEHFVYKKRAKSCTSLRKKLLEDQDETESDFRELKSIREMIYDTSDSDSLE